MSVTKQLAKKQLINPPRFLPDNICYETIMGSVAYGASSDNSDVDIYGFAIPTKEILFPYKYGYVLGFSKNIPVFDHYQQHHIVSPHDNKGQGASYDLTLYSIIKYFRLLADNNPNVLDSIFTPQDCVKHITKVGTIVRDNRKLFLHKGCYHKFRGYAFAQLHKASSKNVQEGSNRDKIRKANNGEDTKFLMHTMRLLLECEQILQYGDIDLRRDREFLKAIRRGEVREKEIRELFTQKEKYLEGLYQSSKIPYGPNEEKIKDLLMQCLEEHYGNLDNFIVNSSKAETVLRNIKELVLNSGV